MFEAKISCLCYQGFPSLHFSVLQLPAGLSVSSGQTAVDSRCDLRRSVLLRSNEAMCQCNIGCHVVSVINTLHSPAVCAQTCASLNASHMH